jgi:hypothetical protein
MSRATTLDVYLEVGKKRTFAGALDWPGWCRRARDEGSALEALVAYGPRYERALRGTRLGFAAPDDASALAVTERLEGDATTEFGAPGAAPSADDRPVDDAELRRLQAVLRACWRALDRAASAEGRELRKGPRGGGRELDAIVEHVRDAEAAYLGRLGWKPGAADVRADVLDAITAGVRDGVPDRGPRGGARWTVRYFVRRAAWHALDHAWEIEDRVT